MGGKVLIIGSAPDAIRAPEVDGSCLDSIVAINNAWRIRDDWTHLIYPDDLAQERMPGDTDGRALVTYEDYVPANNAFGGIVYAGGTMAFTAGYWALHALKPNVMAFIGCDMIYDDDGDSHFYGKGEPDPLRDDPTLQNLEAKSNRLKWLSAVKKCWCVNLSEKPVSRLTFDRLGIAEMKHNLKDPARTALARMNLQQITAPLEAEKRADQFHASGDYWNAKKSLNAAELKRIDNQWLSLG